MAVKWFLLFFIIIIFKYVARINDDDDVGQVGQTQRS